MFKGQTLVFISLLFLSMAQRQGAMMNGPIEIIREHTPAYSKAATIVTLDPHQPTMNYRDLDNAVAEQVSNYAVEVALLTDNRFAVEMLNAGQARSI